MRALKAIALALSMSCFFGIALGDAGAEPAEYGEGDGAWAGGDVWAAAPGVEEATPADAPSGVHCVPHASGEHIDGWIADGLDEAGLPRDGREDALKGQAWNESNWQPQVVNDWDSNAMAGTPSEGLLQIIPTTWASTQTGSAYPFYPCAQDPVVNVAVRAELFDRGIYN